jgi:two-component system cell cycle sensor histidine kinase/response regulator CckA
MPPTAVLVVEDEMIIALGIEKQLEEMGYAVAGTASTGEEAVRKAVELRPDLILMDIALGTGIDGVAAAGLIRKQIDVPVVYLTANSDPATLDRAKLTGPFGYVLKPYEDKDLQTAIEIGLYRHKMEQRVKENERWLAATLGSIGDGVIATDERGRVRFLNALAERLTGWVLADALGRDVTEVFRIFQRTTREPVQNPALEALEKGENVTLAADTILTNRSGGECPIDDSAAPIRDVDGKLSGAVLVFRDITERRRLEDHLRQAQKMEAVGRLAGGIAHDFNNIMTIIIGFSEFLLDEKQSATVRREAAWNIHDAGKRAADLTQQIMAFSRKQMLVPGVLNLNNIVRDMGGMVKRLIGANIEFVTQPDPDLGSVEADPTQIGQVILNLAANARDAMRQGGRLVIATANTALDETITRQYPDVKPGRYVLMSISDTGIGMADEVVAHIFEPFFTTKGVGEGTGLGLATVHGIVKQSGGHIEVTSEVGVGTTFRVYLPLIEEQPLPAGSREIRLPVKGHETILLVEDDEMVRKMTKTILQQSGYTVLEAANGEAALAVAEQHRGRIHLLITDIIMPHLSGREAADRLLALQPGMRVLFMSGYNEDTILHQGVEAATADFLHKPFGVDDLKNKVREVLDRP